MQIIRFEIDEHKCLRDFEIQFSTTDGGSSSIIIGENGTGKSSMLESLLDILMSFESDAVLKTIDYNYYLEYVFAGSNYSIEKAEKKYEIKIDGQLFLKSSMQAVREKLKKENKRIIPWDSIHRDTKLSALQGMGFTFITPTKATKSEPCADRRRVRVSCFYRLLQITVFAHSTAMPSFAMMKPSREGGRF